MIKMSVFRINKNNNYTVMGNYHLRDKNLSYKAKGLLSFMLSLPDDWDYSIKGLVAVSKESIKAIRNILKELQDNGYLIINKIKNEKGLFEYEYLIYEKPDTPFVDMDYLYVEKDTQINTNKPSINNKDKYDKQENVFLKELIKRNFINSNDINIPKYNDLLEELSQEYDYYDLFKVCGYIADKWQDNKGLDENGLPIENKYSYFKTSLINNLEKLANIIDFDIKELLL